LYRRYPAIFFILFSIYVCIVSYRLGLGSLHKPGSGFMPFWSGAFVGILAAIILIQDIVTRRTSVQGETGERVAWKSIALSLFFFLVYILVLERLGYIIATVLFVGIILRAIERKGWFLSSWVAVVMALVSYYIFKVWLQAELPRGFFGF
jgi:putative tricarboxylic transport membrane protein